MSLRETLSQLPPEMEVAIRPKGQTAAYTQQVSGWLEDDGGLIHLEDYELAAPVYLPNGHKEGPADPDPLDELVSYELDKLRVRDRARRQFNLETSPPPELPPILTLRERLALPRSPVEWRIDGWQPAGTRVLLAAQYKAGKTTLTGNLARCLVDDQPWLGVAQVAPVITGTVTILDFEMSERQVDSWLADQGIQADNRVTVIPLRGRATAFDILTDQTRREWAERLAETTYLIFDCLRPVLDALGLDEHREGGRFLTAFDTLCDQAGIEDALIVHHMGHQGERSRGDSRFRDWPDVEWRLVRQDHDDPSSPRYLSAFGRDVDQSEGLLIHDPVTRHITWQGGSRSSVAAREALPDVLEVLRGATEPLSERAVLRLTREGDHPKRAVTEAIGLGSEMGLIHVISQGERRTKWHHHLENCTAGPSCSAAQMEQANRTAPLPIGVEHVRTAETQRLLEDELGAVSDTLEDPW